jgi:hypothetical protein
MVDNKHERFVWTGGRHANLGIAQQDLKHRH